MGFLDYLYSLPINVVRGGPDPHWENFLDPGNLSSVSGCFKVVIIRGADFYESKVFTAHGVLLDVFPGFKRPPFFFF